MNRGGLFKEFVKRHWILILILIVGILVRVYAFGAIPAGLNQDEASIGYDSYAIAHYGIDRNGFHNPVHFKSWGSGQNALYGYLSIPFMWLFGLNVFSVRFVNLLFGLISIFVFYLFVKEISNKSAALVATFLLAICPWHIMLSRWALESNLFPAFFLIGALFLVLSPKKQIYFPISLAFFAVSLYAYSTAFFIVPIFLSISSAYLLLRHRIKLKVFITSLFLFLLLSLPMIIFIAINIYASDSINLPFLSIPELNGARFKSTSTLFGNQIIEKVLPNIKSFFVLMASQNTEIWNALPPYGFYYPLSILFMLFGLWVVLKNKNVLREFDLNFFILTWLIISFVLGAFMQVNGNRINIIFFPLIYLTAVGIYSVKDKISRTLFIFIILLYLVFFLSFTYDYFFNFPEIGPKPEEFGAAINYASDFSKGEICVTGPVNMHYIHVLFNRRINPYVFLSTVKYINPGADFQAVSSFDRYHFELDKCKAIKNLSAYVFYSSEENKFNFKNVSITHFKNYSVAISDSNT